MFGISSTELLIIAVFAFIVFGPDKIPEIARTVSKAVAMFKRTQEDMERTIKTEMYNMDPTSENSIFSAFDASKSASAPAQTPSKSTPDVSGMSGVVDDEEEDEE